MNILQVISSSRTSGAEKHMVVLCGWLRRLGHNVLAACPQGGWLPEQLREAGIPSVEINMRGAKAPGAVIEIGRAAQRHQADLIHAHLTRATYMSFFAGMFSRVPVVSSVHVLTRDFAYRRLPQGNLWFVAVSDHLRGALLQRGVRQDRVATVHNGADLEAMGEPSPVGSLGVRAELGLPADAEIVAEVGRIDEFKGQHILVQAAPQIVAARPRAYFVLVGHAEPRVQQALWEMACAGGVADRLRFTGVRNDIPRLMREADLITLPSLTEACSMVIIEAMAMGKPVVATRAGGNLELVDDGVTGLLVERAPDAVAEATVRILQDLPGRDRMGVAARTRAEERFSARAMAQNMEALYQRVLNR